MEVCIGYREELKHLLNYRLGNPYGAPPGYGGYGNPPPGMGAPPGLGTIYDILGIFGGCNT